MLNRYGLDEFVEGVVSWRTAGHQATRKYLLSANLSSTMPIKLDCGRMWNGSYTGAKSRVKKA